MSATLQQHPSRFPRPIKRFPRNPLNDDAEFQMILEKIYPYLMTAAKKIVKPPYIDPEDLVQEACIKILRNRDSYTSNRGASPITWLLHIAYNQFQSIAKTEFRKKRVPQGINISKSFVDITDAEVIESYHLTNNPFAPFENETEYEMRYQEIIERTLTRLPSFAKKVFFAILYPPEELIDSIKKNIEKKEEERRNGMSVKVPMHFSITSKQLAEHFDVPRNKIAQAKDTINDAMLKAFED